MPKPNGESTILTGGSHSLAVNDHITASYSELISSKFALIICQSKHLTGYSKALRRRSSCALFKRVLCIYQVLVSGEASRQVSGVVVLISRNIGGSVLMGVVAVTVVATSTAAASAFT